MRSSLAKQPRIHYPRQVGRLRTRPFFTGPAMPKQAMVGDNLCADRN